MKQIKHSKWIKCIDVSESSIHYGDSFIISKEEFLNAPKCTPKESGKPCPDGWDMHVGCPGLILAPWIGIPTCWGTHNRFKLLFEEINIREAGGKGVGVEVISE